MSEVVDVQLLPLTVPNNLGDRVKPDYDQIFRPPPLIHRIEGKRYGRQFLHDNYPSEWFKYNRNMKKANKWLEHSINHCPQEIGETKREWLRRNCTLKIAENDTMEPLVFQGLSMTWEVEHIVTHLVEKLDQR